SSEPVRVGVIGCGHWGPNHIRNFAAMPDVVVVGAADPSAERRAAMATQFRGLAVFDQADALLDLRPDAVIIATPVAAHAALALSAIERGVHVLCEKPLAHSTAAAEEMSAAAAVRGVVLMVGHVFVWNAGLRRVKEMLDS